MINIIGPVLTLIGSCFTAWMAYRAANSETKVKETEFKIKEPPISVDMMEKVLENYRTEFDRMIKKVEKAEEDYSLSKKELDDVLALNETLTQENEEKSEENALLSEENEQLKAEKQELIEENRQYKNKIDMLEEKIDKLEKHIKEWRKEET